MCWVISIPLRPAPTIRTVASREWKVFIKMAVVMI